MRYHIRSIKARLAEEGQRYTWDDIAQGTGIRKATLISLANNKARMIRPEYVDALCAYFDVSIGELMSAEEVDLPLVLNLRPDRQGKQIGRS